MVRGVGGMSWEQEGGLRISEVLPEVWSPSYSIADWGLLLRCGVFRAWLPEIGGEELPALVVWKTQRENPAHLTAAVPSSSLLRLYYDFTTTPFHLPPLPGRCVEVGREGAEPFLP